MNIGLRNNNPPNIQKGKTLWEGEPPYGELLFVGMKIWNWVSDLLPACETSSTAGFVMTTSHIEMTSMPISMSVSVSLPSLTISISILFGKSRSKRCSYKCFPHQYGKLMSAPKESVLTHLQFL